MRRTPTRTVRAIAFDGGSPTFSRYTFGSLQVTGMPQDVEHFVRRRLSSAAGISE